MPTPRTAALAVMGMLAFGVLVGSLSNGGIEALASAPSIVLNLGGASPNSSGGSAGASASAGSGGPSGGSNVTQQSQPSNQTASGGSTAGGSTSGASSGNGPAGTGFNGLPPVKHVFLIVLSEQGYNQTFGPGATDKYLSKALARQGELLVDYYAVAASPLANEVALLSGQGPTQDTEADCPAYTPVRATGVGTRAQVLGNGCVYPSTTKTLMGQLAKAHDTWKAYVEGIGTEEAAPCSHPKPESRISEAVTPKRPYDVTVNPFVFFDSITGSKTCKKNDVGIGQLKTDLESAASTPTLSYIVPSPCDDGRQQPCAPGAPSGLGPADRFLKSIVPEIKDSPAYKSDGLIAITFDEAPQTGPRADPSSCCNNPTYPNLPAPTGSSGASTTPTTTTPTAATPNGTATPTTPTTPATAPTTTTPGLTNPSLGGGQTSPTGGGGQVGMLLLSKYVKAGSNDTLDYFNHFAFLGSLEKLLGLGRLGYAKDSSLTLFTGGVFNAQL